jgi:hypothetical protein
MVTTSIADPVTVSVVTPLASPEVDNERVPVPSVMMALVYDELVVILE